MMSLSVWRLRWHHPTGGWGTSAEPWDRESAEVIAATLRRSGCDVVEIVRWP
jgi:hypothetical protein